MNHHSILRYLRQHIYYLYKEQFYQNILLQAQDILLLQYLYQQILHLNPVILLSYYDIQLQIQTELKNLLNNFFQPQEYQAYQMFL